MGYRWREKGEAIASSNINPTGDQLIGSVATSYLLPFADTKLIAEVIGSRPVGRPESVNSRRQASSLEALFGIKYDILTNLAFHAGGGTELINGAASPDWRLYSGINWNIGPVFNHVDKTEEYDLKEYKDETVVVLYRLEFEFDSDRLTPDSLAVLGEVVNLIRSKKYRQLVVEGHTDSVGVAAYNQSLSEKRAERVRQLLLTEYQLAAEKVKAVGYGESKPIALNDNYQSRRRNRRVEIRIVK